MNLNAQNKTKKKGTFLNFIKYVQQELHQITTKTKNKTQTAIKKTKTTKTKHKPKSNSNKDNT